MPYRGLAVNKVSASFRPPDLETYTYSQIFINKQTDFYFVRTQNLML